LSLRGTITNQRARMVGAAAPATGQWQAGDTVEYIAPTAGGKKGTVCTTAGTPGTWKEYGGIDA
jgi:hypothetical protein